MSLILPHTNSWGFRYRNPTVPTVSNADGVSVIPGTSDGEGSFTEIVAAAAVTTDIHYMKLQVTGGTTAGQSKQHLVDLAYDPTGGTTYNRFLFENLACGGSGATATGIHPGGFHFPCKIPAGSAIAARVQGSNGTPGTVRIVPEIFGKPSRPELWRSAAYSETLGYTSGTLGTSFTPGVDGYGSWISLGTTTKKHFWAQLGAQCNNSAIALAALCNFQLGIGDGTNMHPILETFGYCDTNERFVFSLQNPCTWEIQAGAELWVRGSVTSTADSGWNATAVLFGG